MIIKTTKSSFKMVPAGEQDLTVTDVKLVPSGKPQMIQFEYAHDNGGTLKETLKLDNDMSLKILGKRCDLALNGKMPEGTEIDINEIPDMFKGKILRAFIVHKEVEKDGKTNTYANIRYVMEIFGLPEEEEDDL